MEWIICEQDDVQQACSSWGKLTTLFLGLYNKFFTFNVKLVISQLENSEAKALRWSEQEGQCVSFHPQMRLPGRIHVSPLSKGVSHVCLAG